jgi:hypothetical protein
LRCRIGSKRDFLALYSQFMRPWEPKIVPKTTGLGAVFRQNAAMAIIGLAFAFLAMTAPICGAPLPADQAQAHIGETATVQGRASMDRTRAGETYLDLGGSGDSAPVSAYISPRNAFKFPDAEKFSGKDVQITGKISTFRGRPEIFVTDPSQITIVPSAAK